MTEDWPLAGRSETLRQIVATARSRGRAGVVLVGPPGVGRTRLARAALAAVCGAAAPGRSGTHGPPRWAPSWVMAGAATASIPLGAMAHLFPDLDPGRGPTARLLQEARQHLLAAAGGSRIVLAVDDAHVLDDTSAILLQRLAGSGDAFLIVTVPTGIVVPGPVFALWKEGLADRVDVPELDRTQTDALVVRALGGDHGAQVDRAALAHLWRLTHGNPLFLREIIGGGRAAGTLRRVGSVWRWQGPFPGTPRLHEMVDAQLGALDPDERDLMRLLAFGQPLAIEIAATMVTGDVVASAERKGLLRSTRTGNRVDLRLARPLHTEILRARATPLQEREIYGRLADAVAALGVHGAEDRSRLVSWQVAHGRPADPEKLLRAALDLRVRDPALAERLLTVALEQRSGAEMRMRLACGLIRLERLEEAETVLAELDGRAGLAEPTPAALARRLDVAVVRVHNLYWGLRAQDRVLEVLDGAEAGPDPVTGGRSSPPPPPTLTVLRTFRALLDRGPAEALRIVTPAAADPSAGLPVLAVAATASVRAGHYAAAVDYARRADPQSLSDDDGAGGWLRFELMAACWYASLQSGDLDGAEALVLPCHRAAVEEGLERHAALYATWMGITAVRRGLPRTASRWLHEAAAAVPAAGFSFTLPLVSELAVALGDLGETRRARAVLAEGERTPGDPLLPGWTWTPRVWLAGLEGRTSEAAALALRAATKARLHAHPLEALHTAVRLGLTGEVTDRLAALADDAQGPLARAYGEHARALASQDGAALDRVAVRFADLGCILLAAEAAAQAAHAYRLAGRNGSGAASASRAHAWAEHCEGARTPALALLDGSSDLTPREQEIAALAASGMTSKAIAGELVVSVRTVDNMLRSVYAKLGVSGRGDLTQVAGIRSGR